MMDPFTIITAIGTWGTGYKAGEQISKWMNGKNVNHLNDGYEFLTKGIDSQNVDFLTKAISEFDFINSVDDKKFVLAYSYYGRAICYAYLLKFPLSYDYLDKLDEIECDFFTRKTDTIKEIQSYGRTFRSDVKKLEDAYNEYIKSLQESNSTSNQETKINWKLIIFLVVAAILISLFLFFHYFQGKTN